MQEMDNLPPHLKHKILSYDPSLLCAAYGDNEKGKVEGKVGEKEGNYPTLTLHNPTQLRKFTPSLIKSLGERGYIVIDNFLGKDAMHYAKV
jgi:hypothetical protein